MADFAQSGPICTLQRLNDTHLDRIEDELAELSASHPVALILPCHGRDLAQTALRGICHELAAAKWLRDVVVSVNGASDEQWSEARRFFSSWSIPTRCLRQEDPTSGGKGQNVAEAVRLLMQSDAPAVIATQDCDVTTFRRADLARLVYPCVHPALGFAFAKMYYPRVTDRLYGRVSRLFLGPLLTALREIIGGHSLLDFLSAFRYPLAGEVALRADLAQRLRYAGGWGLEIGTLCEVYEAVEPHQVCQVDGGRVYDHQHEPSGRKLGEMSASIAETLFGYLEQAGVTCDAAFHEELRGAMENAVAVALRRYEALSQLNGLPYDMASEARLAATLMESLPAGAAAIA